MKTLEQIGAELQGYDPQALRASDVNAFLAKLVEPVTQTETVSIFAALDRVLAQDVVSPISVPPHDNSAMDGFAFVGAQLRKDAPLALKVIGTAFAGKAWQGTVGPGECVKIMTGAIMPAGLDTVVPQEFTTVAGDRVTIPAKLLQPGDNRRALGEDLMAGRAALPKARACRRRPAACWPAWASPRCRCSAGCKVAYFSTGDEILSLGEPPREGAVYDSNRYTVFGLLTRLGCEVIDLGVVRDEPALLEAAFTRAAQQADAIITSGGVSVGEADFTKTMMKQLGDVAFWRIAMRPGRPMAVGRISGNKLASPQREMVANSYPNDSNLPPLFGHPVRPARQPGGGDGHLPGLRAPRPAAHDGQHLGTIPAAEGAKPGVDPQEAGPHRVPARHRQHRGRRHAASAHHRQPGLGRAEFHGAGQRPDRAAPRSGQRGNWRRGRRDDVRRCDLAP
jgi:molybdopterin molybdotransferase